MEYVAVMRDLTLGFWYNQKVVYQFLPETLEYIKMCLSQNRFRST